ncbi:M15 family metallopeptidase [Streptomyces boninensis]|uniref:M15 family metallopeptidase n=1 Tax=Streptomyces boninensis TaxID=2039455 RepID=UPI003B22069A
MSADVILMSDPQVTAIPVAECGEPLADVRGAGLAVSDYRADADGAFAQLRAGVVERLVEAERKLPDGLRLLFIEGYRPPMLQRRYFDRYAAGLRAANPDWTDERLHTAASRYVSPPEIAPHSAGAAVDLTLTGVDGTPLDMGTRVNANPEESEGACYTAASNISAGARANRELLGAALGGAGLVNYGTEWWHWSYGDRYWALRTGAEAALYGPVEFTA